MHDPDIERAMREEARWRILRGLDAGRPYPVAETVLWRLLAGDLSLPVTPLMLRRELTYLEDRGLLEVFNRESATWSARLSRAGIDIVEYTVPCDPGIARPSKVW